jgi:PelA/Pel-15E family pectate lyase
MARPEEATHPPAIGPASTQSRRAGSPKTGAGFRLVGQRTSAIAATLWLAATALGASPSWTELLRRSDDWHRGTEGRLSMEHVLAWQTAAGDWPKNVDTTGPVIDPKNGYRGTFDNGATTRELRFLARAYMATGEDRARQAVVRGLEHVLSAQYPNGGWPQSYPPGPGYARHITFNDDTMVRLLELVRDVATRDDWAWVGEALRQRARVAFERGVQCILNCQVRSGGRLTAWCAQHDELTLEPRPARSYELVSLSGAESARILRFLMSLEPPSPELATAIKAGASWFETVKLTGIRVEQVADDRVVKPDTTAPPLWARFYELETHRPIFTGRDGVKRYTLAEIERERRNGYAWYGTWGESVARDYQAWRARYGSIKPTTSSLDADQPPSRDPLTTSRNP